MKKTSNVSYSQSQVWAQATTTEAGGSAGWLSARNWLDGIYGETKTKISYPVFQGITYSMNYISVSDAYNMARTLTDKKYLQIK